MALFKRVKNLICKDGGGETVGEVQQARQVKLLVVGGGAVDGEEDLEAVYEGGSCGGLTA